MKNKILAVIIAGTWVTISEFLRNEFLFKIYWVEHFNSIGLKFHTLPINGILWLVWSLILAYLFVLLLQKFSFSGALFIAWLPAFVMMWITIYNLQVLPLKLLIAAVPLSLLEVFVAGIIIKKVLKPKRWKASDFAAKLKRCFGFPPRAELYLYFYIFLSVRYSWHYNIFI